MVICAAVASFADCRNRFDLARRVNVEARLELARRAVADGERVVAFPSVSPLSVHPLKPLDLARPRRGSRLASRDRGDRGNVAPEKPRNEVRALAYERHARSRIH